jgi:hypothetical protein
MTPNLAQRCGAAQRPEHQEVRHQTDQDGHHHGEQERHGRRHSLVTELDVDRHVQRVGRQEVEPWQAEIAVAARLVEGEHPVHGERALGEVDHARAAVDDHEAGPEHRVQRTQAHAREQEEDDVAHLCSVMKSVLLPPAAMEANR